ncbi:MAG: hypothetical protein DMF71_17165 [Acidobacteria bacterium]|nr:MAG: hypothetical protein DMF71_17165 [Acidobacteriota bacterium]
MMDKLSIRDWLRHCALIAVVLSAMTPFVVRADHRPLCLPNGIKPDTIVNSERVVPKRGRAVTVKQLLIDLEIRFYRLIGCWGNPPADYQEMLERQNNELNSLKKKYLVIEIPCQTGDPRRIS